MVVAALLSAVHMLTLALGAGAIFARGRALSRPLDDTGWARLLAADNAWGMAALLWIASGLRPGYEIGFNYSSRTRPRRVATFTASVRLVTPSFSKRCPRWVFTVRSLIASSAAISLLALPSAISRSADISRGVSW